jgi:hypothetical protein
MRRPRRARRVSVPFSCSGRLLVTAAAVLLQLGCRGGDKATLATFSVRYYGHDRGLAITRDGRARESVNSGCCYRVIDLRFQLSQPRGTPRNASVTATVTSVRFVKRSMWPNEIPVPHMGERRTLRFRNGVLTESLTGTTYCAPSRGGDGKCGV